MKTELQYEARILRQQGKPITEIARILGVAKSSISLWVRDIKLTTEQKRKIEEDHYRYHHGKNNVGARINRERSHEKRMVYQNAGRYKAREMRPLHLSGCMLYWAEGAKGRNGIYFVNSDPNMILFFMRFLREELGVEDSEVAIRIHCHTPNLEEIKRIEKYWVSLLKLPMTCVKKTYVKESDNKRNRILENGVCDIRVHRTDLIQHIFGAIQEYGGFENPEWLF
jgi:hypothetical protein